MASIKVVSGPKMRAASTPARRLSRGSLKSQDPPRVLILAVVSADGSAMKTLIEFANANPKILEGISDRVLTYLREHCNLTESELSLDDARTYCEHFLMKKDPSCKRPGDDAGVVFELRDASVVYPEHPDGSGALRQLVVWLAHCILEKLHVKGLKPLVSSFYLLASNLDKITSKQSAELFEKQEDLVRDCVYGGVYTILLKTGTSSPGISPQTIKFLLDGVPYLAGETASVVREMVRDWVHNTVRYQDPEDKSRYIDARSVTSEKDIVKLHEVAFEHLFERPRDLLSKRLTDLHYMWCGRMN